MEWFKVDQHGNLLDYAGDIPVQPGACIHHSGKRVLVDRGDNGLVGIVARKSMGKAGRPRCSAGVCALVLVRPVGTSASPPGKLAIYPRSHHFFHILYRTFIIFTERFPFLPNRGL